MFRGVSFRHALHLAGAVALASCFVSIDDSKMDAKGLNNITPRPDGKCAFDGDCPKIATNPPNCADAACNAGTCVYLAKDSDGDGHRASTCSAPAVEITLGDDCDDTESALFPGGPGIECSEDATGKPIQFPGGAPKGICKRGKKNCGSDGKVGACLDAVPPSDEKTCTTDVDENCDGNPFDACTCTDGQTQPCGASDTPPCVKGKTTCSGGVYGPCVGNIDPKARNCAAAVDNDCNGTADNAEAACQCPGGLPPGGVRACNTHPGQDGIGVCKPGSQTCVPNGGTSSFAACAGDVAATSEACEVGIDRNCNGLAGIDEPAAPNPNVCAHLFACPSPTRAEVCYRSDLPGYTYYCSSGTKTTTGYANFYSSSGSPNPFPPPNNVRLCISSLGDKIGPYGIANACFASCPSGNIMFPPGVASTQLYTVWP